MTPDQPWLVLVTGWTGAGKSTLADLVAAELGATAVSFDWVMSGLRAIPEVWETVELPVERQRRIGWNLMSRVAEQQLAGNETFPAGTSSTGNAWPRAAIGTSR